MNGQNPDLAVRANSYDENETVNVEFYNNEVDSDSDNKIGSYYPDQQKGVKKMSM